MYKLSYLINGISKQEWTFPNKQLCHWKRNQLRDTTHRRNMDNNKELIEAVELVKRHQAWRRDDTGTIEMENPTELGKAIDLIIKHIEHDLQKTRI